MNLVLFKRNELFQWCTRESPLTYGQTELQDMNGSLLLQKAHEAKQQVLLLSDLLQIQLQHLIEEHTLTHLTSM